MWQGIHHQSETNTLLPYILLCRCLPFSDAPSLKLSSSLPLLFTVHVADKRSSDKWTKQRIWNSLLETSSGLYIALCLEAIAECEDQTEEGKPSWRFDKTAATRYRLCIKWDIILGFPHLCFVEPQKITQFSTSTLVVFIRTPPPLFNFPTRWKQIVRPSGSFSNKKHPGEFCLGSLRNGFFLGCDS